MSTSGLHGLHPDLKHAAKRSSRPIVFENVPTKLHLPLLAADKATELPNTKNVQGDIYMRFPKVYQAFIFFVISDVVAFKTALRSYQPTSTYDVTEALRTISKAKEDGSETDIVMTQIAFSRLGMNALGESGRTGDPRFDKGSMRQDKDVLGDKSDWDQPFESASTHGVVMVCAKGKATYAKGKEDIISLFKSSIQVLQTTDVVEGNVRPGEFKGHEHFGYLDSLSEPALRGLSHAYPGQIQVDPGVILMGYKGDPVFDNPGLPQRPEWTKCGSMMVFRKLEQDVLGFRDYLTKNGPSWREFTPVPDEVQPPLSDAEGAEFFGARIVGRWKSGTPLALAHFRDTKPPIGGDPEKTNDFDYVRDLPLSLQRQGPSDRYCPFTAHTRKTAPRNLNPYIDQKFLESAIIARSGIPYGSEVTDATKDEKRGLLFVCYQSSLDNGFYLQTTGFAGNDYFPVTSLVPQKHGQDPILGGPEPVSNVDGQGNISSEGQVTLVVKQDNTSSSYEVTGWAKKVDPSAKPPFEPQYWVTSRGGEYYFVPSISTLQTWATDGRTPTSATSGLDIMFLQDATGSLQPYVNQARDDIATICDTLIQSGNWSRDDLRIGLVTFRDHPPQDTTFVTQTYDFTTDISSIMQTLANLEAKGGGDGPEAQSDALAEALTANWRDGASKVVVLITDAPPHGIGEDQDKFPDGCPLQNDPVHIANQMANYGITLYVVACEPKLSGYYSTAHDFYAGIAQKTGGQLVGMSDVTALANLIIGSASQSIDTDALVNKYQDDIRSQAAANTSFADILTLYNTKFKNAGVQVNTCVVEDIYEKNDQGIQNQQVWLGAEKLDKDVVGKIQTVTKQRLKAKYRSTSGTAQSPKVQKQAISQDQVLRVVRQSLVRTTKS
ncbi:Dyp-type peroxidase [Leucogyrophana mollusca]|uniref:Dyp-type peroxidase n=1 Tax=Leucogyrophana mollusca TaxID=85980 RepID=A0ACB8B9T0_9AGAM|nr:Dyp-type peroxidase [Leucogyrophana mollusca]